MYEVQRPIEIPYFNDSSLAEYYTDQYGVQFDERSDNNTEEFNQITIRLIDHRVAIEDTAKRLQVSNSKRAVVYRPGFYLHNELSKEQLTAINDAEAPAIANIVTHIQTEIADVPIHESGEKLISLPELFDEHDVGAQFSELPFHEACGEWAGKGRVFWVREGVGNRLLVFGKLLQHLGLEINFEDAFRPPGVQEGLFKRRLNWTRSDHPDWSEAKVLCEAKSKTASTPRLASHKAGAAIDATLKDIRTGTGLAFGHNYPDGGALVYPKSPFQTFEQWRNRQIFQLAAGLSDLTLYVGEDWHLSYGDNLAALDENGKVRADYVAHFGPIKQFDPKTGEITEGYTVEEINSTFDY